MTTVPAKVQAAYGQLPEGWRLERLKFFSDVRNSNVDKTVSDEEKAVQLCNYTDVYYNDQITPDMPFMIGSATEAEIEKFQLRAGQVIITKDSESWDDIGIPALVTADMPNVLCGYHLSVFEAHKDFDGGFLSWLCRSEPLNDQFKLGANGVTRYGLGQYPIKNSFVAVPPLETQKRIAQFLDEKTAQIDALIEKKRALLDRLAEKRQTLITRAVTKGLNPKAPMKPSGIDWLGEIPEHWEVAPLRWYFRTSAGVGISYEDVSKRPNDIDKTPVVGGNGVMGFTKAANSGGCEIVIGRVGAWCGNVHQICEPAWITDNALKVTEIRGFHVPFLAHALRIRDLNSLASRNAQPLMTGGMVKSQSLPKPTNAEQVEVAKFISNQCSAIDLQTKRIRGSTGLLNEYRAAIITAAVTGQIAHLK